MQVQAMKKGERGLMSYDLASRRRVLILRGFLTRRGVSRSHSSRIDLTNKL
jgi:hypothetical protein